LTQNCLKNGFGFFFFVLPPVFFVAATTGVYTGRADIDGQPRVFDQRVVTPTVPDYLSLYS